MGTPKKLIFFQVAKASVCDTTNCCKEIQIVNIFSLDSEFFVITTPPKSHNIGSSYLCFTFLSECIRQRCLFSTCRIIKRGTVLVRQKTLSQFSKKSKTSCYEEKKTKFSQKCYTILSMETPYFYPIGAYFARCDSHPYFQDDTTPNSFRQQIYILLHLEIAKALK